ncbi:fungal specific transcription factor domain-containing protein [Aspergillus tanneri]|nr:uncharacterized protein ATNIH1004_006153 [Aspergillus tanneri]KAA8647460.1 hypothetical protein ATNIH1004_006153 [Aspergillus tanneri]
MDRVQALSERTPVTEDLDFNRPIYIEHTQIPPPPLPTPATPSLSTVNGPMGTPLLFSPTPSPQYPSADWLANDPTHVQQMSPVDCSSGFFKEQTLSSCLQGLISVDDHDQTLFTHFVDHVLKLAFPVLEAHRGCPGQITEVLGSMQSNSSYLHCCLSAAAVHLKSSMRMEDQMDHDIVQHRWNALSQLSRALDRGSGHTQVMDATLALIFYDCSVGSGDEYLPDVPWTIHFQAVSSLIKKLNTMPTAFNISLVTWIDILGATMLGETPEFSHTYRTKHVSGTPSGMQGLMGCDDRVMYLISEIACLESLKKDGLIDNAGIFSHVTALNAQIDWTEPADQTLQPPYLPSGAIRPDMLTKIISAIFRIGARIYLFSLIPGFDLFEPAITNMVASVAEILNYLPTGPNGYDRCLVWPLFMIGVHSEPSSVFRRSLTERVAALGYLGDFGSFGRMYRLLREVWRVNNQTPTTPTTNPDTQQGESISQGSATTGQQMQQVHWRDVMQNKEWKYLLI